MNENLNVGDWWHVYDTWTDEDRFYLGVIRTITDNYVNVDVVLDLFNHKSTLSWDTKAIDKKTFISNGYVAERKKENV